MLLGVDIEVFFNYGVPTGILLFLLFALWRVTLWVKAEVVQPTVAAHLTLIRTIQEHLPKQTNAIEDQSVEMSKQTKEIKTQTGLLITMAYDMDVVHKVTNSMREVLEKAAHDSGVREGKAEAKAEQADQSRDQGKKGVNGAD